MARVEFLRAYNYTPSGERRVTVHYKAGHTYTVKRECADAAIAAGAGVEVETPRKERPVEERFNGADAQRFDHDGNGEPGGSKPKEKAKG